MREMMFVFAAIILTVCETRSLDPGTTQSTPLKSNTSSSLPKVYAVRNASFNQGDDVNLTCSDKPWTKMIYVIWEIDLYYKQTKCKIGHSDKDTSTDTCKDGKSLRNTSTAQPYLHIPNFSNYDVGAYKCETVYAGGADNVIINVEITVSPSTSAWLERNSTGQVAVCKAERGKPAANISWSHIGNASLETWHYPDGFFTVESRLLLPDSMDTTNLNCTVRHPSWKGERIWVPKSTEQGRILTLLCILLVVMFIVVLAGFLFFAQKKLTMLRCCRQADTSPSKSPPTEDVEEVEPYASYHQRVNSIYNS